ncbi:hypothetical protein PU629_10290 [Pullulanibacillus sp. KACC 23026]|uniref:hypothetical protein n=1 Tax=Pullulanibacillus sp. KACC 23026 TaxID=3028315 RepID=UPI0023B103FD|nr:hypothetical protein [Pullulanibacillus sp. KACC 23026]WEG14703.1 hypothetical protein PU629_10290 [Pullulanibacillus sp. KACC 23026]
MTFFGLIIIIVLIYFLIIRPLTRRDRPTIYEPRRNRYNGLGDYGREDWRRSGGTGMGTFGSFAGGMATGALLTYLFEQGRIGFDHYQALQGLGDDELLRELEDQNILQQDEIDQLREEMNGQNDWDLDNQDRNPLDARPDAQQDDLDFGNWDNDSDDNWL